MLDQMSDTLEQIAVMVKAIDAMAVMLSYSPGRDHQGKADPVTAAYDSLNIQPTENAVRLACQAALCTLLAYDKGQAAGG